MKGIDKPAAAKDWETFMTQHKEIAGSCFLAFGNLSNLFAVVW